MYKRFFLLLLLLPSLCFAEEFIEGKDYEVVGNSQQQNAKVKVTEFFSYGCPWCYRVEPQMMQWVTKQNQKINFKRIPVIFNKDWLFYAKAYYTGNLLGLGTAFDETLFKAIQTDKKSLTSNEAMVNFLVSQGITKDTADSAINNSTAVDLKIKIANEKMMQYHISAVPAIVVAGHYKTDLKMAQSIDRLFLIMNFLVGKEKNKG